MTFPNSPYAHPVSSFEVPVAPPDYDPFNDPVVTVCFESHWLPYVIGCLKQLRLQSTWDVKTGEPGLTILQEQVEDLIGRFSDQPVESLCPPPSAGCQELAPDWRLVAGQEPGVWFEYTTILPDTDGLKMLEYSFAAQTVVNLVGLKYPIEDDPPVRWYGGILRAEWFTKTPNDFWDFSYTDENDVYHHYSGYGDSNLSAIGLGVITAKTLRWDVADPHQLAVEVCTWNDHTGEWPYE